MTDHNEIAETETLATMLRAARAAKRALRASLTPRGWAFSWHCETVYITTEGLLSCGRNLESETLRNALAAAFCGENEDGDSVFFRRSDAPRLGAPRRMRSCRGR